MDEERLAKAIVKEQRAADEIAKRERQADSLKALKGCAIVFFGAIVAIPLAVAVCFSSIPDGDYMDPNDEPANVAAKEELQSFAWVRDLYVSPGHLNIGVIPGEKEWGAPMITLAVCSVLERHGSDVRRVRFVDADQIAAGKTPRGAEIIAVACPDREDGELDQPNAVPSVMPSDAAVEALRNRIAEMPEVQALSPLRENEEEAAVRHEAANADFRLAVDSLIKGTEPDHPLWSQPNPKQALEVLKAKQERLSARNKILGDEWRAAMAKLNQAGTKAVRACMKKESASEKQCARALNVTAPSLLLKIDAAFSRS